MKKIIKILSLLLFSFLLLLLLSLGILLRFPQWFIQSDTWVKIVAHQNILENIHWEKLNIDVDGVGFIHYEIAIDTKGLDASLSDQNPQLSLQNLSGSLKVDFKWSFSSGIQILPKGSSNVHASKVTLTFLPEVKANNTEEKSSDPIYWKKLYKEILSSVQGDSHIKIEEFKMVQVENTEKKTDLFFQPIQVLLSDHEIRINSDIFPEIKEIDRIDFQLSANLKELSLDISHPKSIGRLKKPQCQVAARLLDKMDSTSPILIQCNSSLSTGISTREGLLRNFPRFIEQKFVIKGSAPPVFDEYFLKDMSILADAGFSKSTLKLSGQTIDLFYPFDKVTFLKTLIEKYKIVLQSPNLSEFLSIFPEAYQKLPTPLTPLNGPIEIEVYGSKTEGDHKLHAETLLLLRNKDQHLNLRAKVNTSLNLNEEAFDLSNISMELDILKLNLLLPEISPTKKITRIFSDGRIKSGKDPVKKPLEASTPYQLNIKNQKPLVLKTGLIDKNIRLNMDLRINNNGLERGYLEILPMNFSVFKRPIKIIHFKLSWPASGAEAGIKASLVFPLPEYTVFLEIDGLVSEPKTLLRSKPPLAENDIYSVLLFGQPMDSLDPQDKSGMNRVQSGLSQGFLSLSTLYLLAGTRIEKLVYDPQDSTLSTSLRLSKKYSLQVGVGEGDVERVGLRRSLGNGWFIESNTKSNERAGDQAQSFGLLLQRVIAY